jgi:hypothetical protein
MSSHFNYEIDEKHLRAKLRGMSAAYRDDAWTQFEAYADTCKNPYKTSSLPNFNLNINRNIVLPVVFGGVIILFSMLLFNFINISTKTPEKMAVADTKPVEPPKAKAATVVAPVKKDTVVVIKQDTAKIAAPSLSLSTPPVSQSLVANTNSTPATPTVAFTPSVDSKPVVNTNTVAANAAAPGTWFAFESCDVYENPNIASKIVGNVKGNQSYAAVEETNYFIKVEQGGAVGYVLKSRVRKNGTYTGAPRRKREAAQMETKQAPSLLPTAGSEEKEPELR